MLIAGGMVALVVVVCIGFLLVVIVVGILKMRTSRKPRRHLVPTSDDGLAWDDSGMNIIVNPIEDVRLLAALLCSAPPRFPVCTELRISRRTARGDLLSGLGLLQLQGGTELRIEKFPSMEKLKFKVVNFFAIAVLGQNFFCR